MDAAGRKSFANGDYAAAEQAFGTLLGATPPPPADLRSGWSLRLTVNRANLGRADDAEQTCRLTLHLQFGNGDAHEIVLHKVKDGALWRVHEANYEEATVPLVTQNRAQLLTTLACSRAAQALLIELFGRDSVEATVALGRVGDVLMEIGHFSEALTLFQQCVEIYTKVVGAKSHLVVTVKCRAADALAALGRHDDALRLLHEVTATARGFLDSLPLAAVLVRAGHIHRVVGHVDNAVLVLEEASALRLEAHGPQHAETRAAFHELGLAHEARGNVVDAVANHRRAFAVLSGDAAKASIAVDAERAEGDDELRSMASRLEEQCALEPDRTDLWREAANCRYELAARNPVMSICCAARRAAESLLAAQERALGPSHPDLVETLLLLARSIKLGAFELRELLDIQRHVERAVSIATSHKATLATAAVVSLADVFLELGFSARAQGLLQHALQCINAQENGDLVVRVLGLLGTSERQLGHAAAVVAVFHQLLHVLEALPARERVRVSALLRLCSAFEAVGDLDRALQVASQARDLAQRVAGPNSVLVSGPTVAVVAVLGKLGRHDEADQHYKAALRCTEPDKIPGPQRQQDWPRRLCVAEDVRRDYDRLHVAWQQGWFPALVGLGWHHVGKSVVLLWDSNQDSAGEQFGQMRRLVSAADAVAVFEWPLALLSRETFTRFGAHRDGTQVAKLGFVSDPAPTGSVYGVTVGHLFETPYRANRPLHAAMLHPTVDEVVNRDFASCVHLSLELGAPNVAVVRLDADVSPATFSRPAELSAIGTNPEMRQLTCGLFAITPVRFQPNQSLSARNVDFQVFPRHGEIVRTSGCSVEPGFIFAGELCCVDTNGHRSQTSNLVMLFAGGDVLTQLVKGCCGQPLFSERRGGRAMVHGFYIGKVVDTSPNRQGQALLLFTPSSDVLAYSEVPRYGRIEPTQPTTCLLL